MTLASYLALAAAVFILALTPGPVVVATVALGFAWLASRARRFTRSERAVKAVNRTSGTLMIGAGAWVATR